MVIFHAYMHATPASAFSYIVGLVWLWLCSLHGHTLANYISCSIAIWICHAVRSVLTYLESIALYVNAAIMMAVKVHVAIGGN